MRHDLGSQTHHEMKRKFSELNNEEAMATNTLVGLRDKINFAREMITELARCKTRANWLLSDELQQRG